LPREQSLTERERNADPGAVIVLRSGEGQSKGGAAAAQLTPANARSEVVLFARAPGRLGSPALELGLAAARRHTARPPSSAPSWAASLLTVITLYSRL
jgi:hypothetical protein